MEGGDRERGRKSTHPLESFVSRKVQVVTTEGRVFVGDLTGLDQALNVFLTECEERVYSKDEGVELIKQGLYLIRGEMITLIGELDEAIEVDLDFDNIKAEPLKPIIN